MSVQMSALALQAVPVAGTDLTLLTVFVGIIAACVLLITLVLVGMGIALLRVKSKVEKQLVDAKRKAQPMISEARAKVEPIIGSVTAVVQDLQPKIKSVTEDVVELSHMVRAQATDLDSTLSDVTQKARSQVNRVNGFVNSTLDTTATVASNLEKGVRIPIREIAGVVNGLRAGVETFFQGRAERGAPRGFGRADSTGRRPMRDNQEAEGKASGQGPETYAGTVPSEVARQVHEAAVAAQDDAVDRARDGQKVMQTEAVERGVSKR